jgi:DNA-binding NarL/FixJ family response regulator
MRTLLNTVPNFEVIGFSLDGTNLYDEVINNKANILILDISMPKDGIEVIKEFQKKDIVQSNNPV